MHLHLVQFSGGVGSWMTALRVRERMMEANDVLILLFADTKIEDPDLYRFIEEAAEDVGGELVSIEDGRDPWKVFFDVRYLGNSRVDPCSRILKRDLLRRWIDDNCCPLFTTVYLGIDWSEIHRFERAVDRWEPIWEVKAPLCEAPLISKDEMIEELQRRGIQPPSLYGYGFPHNNCGGFCIKAGIGQFALLYHKMPHRYAYHEGREQELREYLGKDVSILKDRRGGAQRTLTLTRLRERIEAGEKIVGVEDFGGCGCAID